MVVLSGSGKTKTVADIAETAREIGGKVGLITSNPTRGSVGSPIVVVLSSRSVTKFRTIHPNLISDR